MTKKDWEMIADAIRVAKKYKKNVKGADGLAYLTGYLGASAPDFEDFIQRVHNAEK